MAKARINKEKKDFAYFISLIFSPPLVAATLILGYALTVAGSKTDFWYWGGVAAVFAVILPSLFVLGGWLRGSYSDLHLERREDRFWPFFVGIFGTATAIWILMQSNAPYQYIVLMISVLINMIVFTLITLAWKISIHTSTLTAGAIAAIYLYGWEAIIVLGFLPLIMWARLARNKHTPLQTIAGIVVATIVTMIVFYIFDFRPAFWL